MSYRRWVSFLMALAVATMLASPVVGQQRDAEVALQQAMQVEQVQGDLERAIRLYQDIVAQHGDARGVAAKALLHIGMCYETLGAQEAERAYQRVIDRYGDQVEVVSQARAHLAALRPAVSPNGAPVARRVLSYLDTDINDFIDMAPSPDGRRMAHINYWDGGVYVRDLASGRDERVAVGEPDVWYYGPRWSPDGTRLAVGFDYQKAKGAAVRVIDVASHRVSDVPGTEVDGAVGARGWSPDGRRLFCHRSGQLVLIGVDDGAVTVLVDSLPSGTGALSSDGRFVAYALGARGSEQIFVKPVSGGAPRQITEASGGNSGPMWSPDGTAIAYEREDGIWLVPVANGSASDAPKLVYPTTAGTILNGWTAVGGLHFTVRNDVTLPYRIPVNPTTGGPGSGAAEVLVNHPDEMWMFAWAPDMQRVAYGGFQRATISILSADGSASTYDVAPGARVANLWWSVGGREVVFVRRGHEPPYGDLGIGALDPATGRVRDVRPPNSSLHVFAASADGRKLLVIKPEGTELRSRSLAVADSDLQNVRVLAPPVDAEGTPLSGWVRPALSPQGDWMVFGRQADAGSLWIVGTDGAGARRLADVRGIWSAVWDPTGRFIAYTGAVDSATTVLRVVDVASGATRDVPLPSTGVRPLKVPGADYRVVDWSPDGRFLGVVMSEDRWEFWALQGLQASAPIR